MAGNHQCVGHRLFDLPTSGLAAIGATGSLHCQQSAQFVLLPFDCYAWLTPGRRATGISWTLFGSIYFFSYFFGGSHGIVGGVPRGRPIRGQQRAPTEDVPTTIASGGDS